MHQPSIAPLLAGNILGSSNNSFVVSEWQDEGGPAGPPRLIAPRHVHHNDDEAWYVLEGTLRVQSGEKEIEASAGSAVLVPRGTPHTFWNPGPARVRYLLIMTPNVFSLIEGFRGSERAHFPHPYGNSSKSTIPSCSSPSPRAS
jgi:mannose-6-phosphate isomerase-like protein (cupin superfamily)